MLTGEPNLAAYDPAGSVRTSSLRPAVGPLSGRNSRFRKLAGLTNPAMPIFGPARVTRTAKSGKRLRTQSRSGCCARVRQDRSRKIFRRDEVPLRHAGVHADAAALKAENLTASISFAFNRYRSLHGLRKRFGHEGACEPSGGGLFRALATSMLTIANVSGGAP